MCTYIVFLQGGSSAHSSKSNHVSCFSLDGSMVWNVKLSTPAIFTIERYNDYILLAGGRQGKVDLFTNYGDVLMTCKYNWYPKLNENGVSAHIKKILRFLDLQEHPISLLWALCPCTSNVSSMSLSIRYDMNNIVWQECLDKVKWKLKLYLSVW